MKRVLIVLCLILLIGCTQRSPENVDELVSAQRYVRSGSQGVEIDFVQNLPPERVFSTTSLDVLLEVTNQGAYDLEQNDCYVSLGGFDNNIISGLNTRKSCDALPGKSAFNLDGGFNQVGWEGRVTLPQGVNLYSPDFIATTCYKYTTIAAPQVCVDPNFYSISSEQKACSVSSVGLSSQGAPVAVTSVQTDMVGSKAVFTLDISNVGGGRVLSLNTPLSRCPNNLDFGDFDVVGYSVKLADQGGDCSPKNGRIRLSSGRGRVICNFNVGQVPAFESLLRVDLNYNYLDSVSTPVQIISTR